MERPALSTYVNAYGQGKLARDLGLSQGATQAWSAGRAMPHPDRAAELVVLSKGKLTLEAIYAPELKAAREKIAKARKAKPKAKSKPKAN